MHLSFQDKPERFHWISGPTQRFSTGVRVFPGMEESQCTCSIMVIQAVKKDTTI